MPHYSNSEKADILFMSVYANDKAREAVRIYRMDFPNRALLDRRTSDNYTFKSGR